MTVREQDRTIFLPVRTNGDAFTPAPTSSDSKSRSWKFWVAITLAAVLVCAAIGAGAFFLGQGTRLSGGQVSHRVAGQAARDRVFYGHKLTSALNAQEAHLTRVMKSRVKHTRDSAFSNGQAQGYSSGHAQGYSSGSAVGEADGKRKGKAQGRELGQAEGYSQGFDEGTCYTPGTLDYVC